MIPIAPAAFARSDLDTNEQVPRRTKAIAPFSEPLGSVVLKELFGSVDGPQRYGSTGFPSVPLSVPTSTSVWSAVTHAGGVGVRLGSNGTPGPRPGTAGVVTVIICAKMCLFETAATVIASGAVPGVLTEPKPKSARSFPAAIATTTPACVTPRTACMSASCPGSSSGPPPEKLITSIPSATADSKAATICADVALLPIGVGVLKTRWLPIQARGAIPERPLTGG